MSDRLEVSIKVTDTIAERHVTKCYDAICSMYGNVEVRGSHTTIGALRGVLGSGASFVEDRAMGDGELSIIGRKKVLRGPTLFD